MTTRVQPAGRRPAIGPAGGDRCLLRWLVVLVVSFLLPTVLPAQELEVNAPAPGAFDLRIRAGGRFTNNPTLGPGDGGAEGDSIADLRAELTGRRTSPRTAWSATYSPFYTGYRTNDQLNTLNHSLNFNGRYILTRRSSLSLLERTFYSLDPLQIGSADPSGEAVILTRQSKRWRNYTDAAFDTALSDSVTLQMGASARFERFALESLVDTDTYAGRLGIQKRVGRQDSIASTYTYSRFGVHLEEVETAAAQGIDFAWTHGAPERTMWVLSAGMTNVTREDERQKRLTADASLRHRFRRLDLVSGYNRSLGADAAVANVMVAQNAYVALGGRVGRRTSLGLRAEYGSRDSVLDVGERLSLTYVGGALHGEMSINQVLSFAAEARRRRQSVTQGAAEDLTVNEYFLGMVFQVF